MSFGVGETFTVVFFATKEELYYMIAGYINTLQALWITK
jgi:thioredoxin-related protein